MVRGGLPLVKPAALGFRAGRGGSVVVAVAWDDGNPRVVLSTFLATAAEGDRLAFEPYHVAADMPRGPDRRSAAVQSFRSGAPGGRRRTRRARRRSIRAANARDRHRRVGREVSD